jgi:murein DD-endopeptidase MepM/ murein hydrolase activator NlpD
VDRRRALLIAACLLSGCWRDRPPMHPESPPGRWYVVSEGETLADIAKNAGVPAEDILEINGLDRPDQVRPGKLLFVLDGAANIASAAPAATIANRSSPSPSNAGRLRWPLEKPFVGSPFGTRGGRPHEGIDLPAAIGTPVFAAAAGRVVYAGNGIRGYGNLIVLQHPGDLLTVYAHNSALLVAQGDQVQAGQKVALVGQTGHATGPHLHFEVRQGQIPRDPMTFFGGPP